MTLCTGHMVSVVFSMWVVGPKIAIGLYLLDTWSVLYFRMWELGSKIPIVLYVLDM